MRDAIPKDMPAFINTYLMEANNRLTAMITGISYENLKAFKDGSEDIGIAKYAKLLFDATQDFRILSMNIERA